MLLYVFGLLVQKRFNREREALNTIEDINRLFCNSSSAPFPDGTYVKSRNQLAKEFEKQKAHYPEISSTVPNGALSVKYSIAVWVDPYAVSNQELRDWVDKITRIYRAEYNIHFRNWAR